MDREDKDTPDFDIFVLELLAGTSGVFMGHLIPGTTPNWKYLEGYFKKKAEEMYAMGFEAALEKAAEIVTEGTGSAHADAWSRYNAYPRRQIFFLIKFEPLNRKITKETYDFCKFIRDWPWMGIGIYCGSRSICPRVSPRTMRSLLVM